MIKQEKIINQFIIELKYANITIGNFIGYAPNYDNNNTLFVKLSKRLNMKVRTHVIIDLVLAKYNSIK